MTVRSLFGLALGVTGGLAAGDLAGPTGGVLAGPVCGVGRVTGVAPVVGSGVGETVIPEFDSELELDSGEAVGLDSGVGDGVAAGVALATGDGDGFGDTLAGAIKLL